MMGWPGFTRRWKLTTSLVVATLLCLALGGASDAALHLAVHLPVPDPTVAPNRAVEPIVLTGAAFPGIAVPQNTTVKAPFTDLVSCPPGSNTDGCTHNEYSPPQVDTSGAQNRLPIKGVY